MVKHRVASLIGAALVCLLVARTASASTIFWLTETDAGGTSPFGKITLTQDGTNVVDVNVHLFNGDGFVDTGGPHHSFGFNIDGDPTIPASDVTNLSPGFSVSDPLASGTFAPWGTFDYFITGPSPNSPITSDLNFTLTLPSLTEASFVANTGGYYFAADLVADGTTGRTGNRAALGPGTPSVTITADVPEPGTIVLLGSALAGLAARRRARKRS